LRLGGPPPFRPNRPDPHAPNNGWNPIKKHPILVKPFPRPTEPGTASFTHRPRDLAKSTGIAPPGGFVWARGFQNRSIPQNQSSVRREPIGKSASISPCEILQYLPLSSPRVLPSAARGVCHRRTKLADPLGTISSYPINSCNAAQGGGSANCVCVCPPLANRSTLHTTVSPGETDPPRT
jgi:hypothetical protein